MLYNEPESKRQRFIWHVVPYIKMLSGGRSSTHLGLSLSGRSRGWNPHCPCVSSPPPLGCSGLRHRCLPPAAPVGAGGASAHAPETPAGTGSSCPPLQVSGEVREQGGKQRLPMSTLLDEGRIRVDTEHGGRLIERNGEVDGTWVKTGGTLRAQISSRSESPKWLPSPTLFTPWWLLRLQCKRGPWQGPMTAVLCSNLVSSCHHRRQWRVWLPATDQNNRPSISDRETQVDSSRSTEWWW